jgi:hypothetical protein
MTNQNPPTAKQLSDGMIRMRIGFANTPPTDARIFRYILDDYLICRERDLLSISDNWGQEVARWLNRAGGMAGDW